MVLFVSSHLNGKAKALYQLIGMIYLTALGVGFYFIAKEFKIIDKINSLPPQNQFMELVLFFFSGIVFPMCVSVYVVKTFYPTKWKIFKQAGLETAKLSTKEVPTQEHLPSSENQKEKMMNSHRWTVILFILGLDLIVFIFALMLNFSLSEDRRYGLKVVLLFTFALSVSGLGIILFLFKKYPVKGVPGKKLNSIRHP